MRVLRDRAAAERVLLERSSPLDRAGSARLRARIKAAFGEEMTAEAAVSRILEEVRARGDAALQEYTQRLDGVYLDRWEVTAEEVAQAYELVDQGLLSALSVAAERIHAYHEAQKRHSSVNFSLGGLGQIVRPLERVGLYVPGGRAAYPSTVLMTAIPAKVAGVSEIVLATPPRRDGSVWPQVLVAAHLADVDRVFKMGGAQAIAALAYGTESVPQVDKICGPGNVFVQLAKKMVYGTVAIDALEGPSESVVLADETANPVFCAADLLAQAEHDELASAVLITTSANLAQQVEAEVAREVRELERAELVSHALEEQGYIILVDTLEQGIELVNRYAPEHLSLLVRDPWRYVDQVHNAGTIFVGERSAAALGDYVAGPSHVMPTGGTARFSSPLRVEDFLKITNIVSMDDQTIADVGPAAVALARAEGLTAHAQAIELRLKTRAEDTPAP